MKIGLLVLPSLLVSLYACAEHPFADWKGTYQLSESTVVNIEQSGDDWLWTREGGTAHALVFEGSVSASAPTAGISLNILGEGENARLIARRYEEEVVLPRPGEKGDALPEADLPALLDTLTPRLMLAWDVPGVSIALVKEGEIAWLGQYGVKENGGTEKVGPDTVFEAASMSKPFFAYIVLQMFQEGSFDLDKPLVEYLGRPYIDDDARHELMTGRMILSHSGGFPNWRPGGRAGGGPIPIRFDPGARFSYSGEGFWFLQQAIEEKTGLFLDELSRERLIDPLGMSLSSYVWKDEYEKLAAAGHDEEGQIPGRTRSIYRTGNSAFTLYSTPQDFSRFLIEMVRDDRSADHSLDGKFLQEMLTPIIEVTGRTAIERSFDGEEGVVHYGLGWRIEEVPSGLRYCHSGSNRNGFRCYSEFNPTNGNGIVIMTNSSGGHRLWQELLRYVGEI